MLAKEEARLLKKELMKRWPNVEFSVIGGRRSRRDTYHVHWKGGPLSTEVWEVARCFDQEISVMLNRTPPTCG